MAKCNVQWQNKSTYYGLLMVKESLSFQVSCELEYGHDGKHVARFRSNVNNSIARMEW